MTPTQAKPLVALISATPASIPPAQRAFAEAFPDAELWNLLDDGLLEQANRAGGLNGHLRARMQRLIQHAVVEGADAILLTCSMYSSIADLVAADLDVPILGPDDAAFVAATDGSYRNVLVIASLPAALADVEARLSSVAERRGVALEVTGVVADGAFDAVQSGDTAALLTALESAASAHHAADLDAVLLAQYSLTPVAAQLAQHTGKPVLSGPILAAQTLRDAVAEGGVER